MAYKSTSRKRTFSIDSDSESVIVVESGSEDDTPFIPVKKAKRLPIVSSTEIETISKNQCCGCGRCCACNKTTPHPALHISCLTGFTSTGLPKARVLSKVNDADDVGYSPMIMPTRFATKREMAKSRVDSYMLFKRIDDPFTLPPNTTYVLICPSCQPSFGTLLMFNFQDKATATPKKPKATKDPVDHIQSLLISVVLSHNGSFHSYSLLSHPPENVSLIQAFNLVSSESRHTDLDSSRSVSGYKGSKLPKGKAIVCEFRSDVDLQEWIRSGEPYVGMVVYKKAPANTHDFDLLCCDRVLFHPHLLFDHRVVLTCRI
jgi:hypothetical protein